MGKGSKRRVEDFQKIQNNWGEINWSDTWDYCMQCGIIIDKKNIKENPELYIIHYDGMIEHKKCQI